MFGSDRRELFKMTIVQKLIVLCLLSVTLLAPYLSAVMGDGGAGGNSSDSSRRRYSSRATNVEKTKDTRSDDGSDRKSTNANYNKSVSTYNESSSIGNGITGKNSNKKIDSRGVHEANAAKTRSPNSIDTAMKSIRDHNGDKVERSNSKTSNSSTTLMKYHFPTHAKSPSMDSKDHYLMLDKRAEKSSSYRNCLAYFMEIAAMSERCVNLTTGLCFHICM